MYQVLKMAMTTESVHCPVCNYLFQVNSLLKVKRTTSIETVSHVDEQTYIESLQDICLGPSIAEIVLYSVLLAGLMGIILWALIVCPPHSLYSWSWTNLNRVYAFNHTWSLDALPDDCRCLQI